MNRKQFLKDAAAMAILPLGCARLSREYSNSDLHLIRRVRPGDPSWPSDADWDQLAKDVGGRLIKVQSPQTMYRALPDELRSDFIKNLRNPYFINEQPGFTQTSGYADAWVSAPSVYAVVAETTADVVAGVSFARAYNLRLVVKGGGHSYQGGSCSADSLLIWTRAMSRIDTHVDFVPQGCRETQSGVPVVSVEAGALWGRVYDVVTTKGGRYVQGGGCTTVGVAGLIQSGGFGSFSKRYGMAAASLLEAEVVTADGVVLIVNACTNSDLFWALKGGGGGSFGVVTKLTLRTHDLPEYFGGVFGAIKANSDNAFRRLIARFLKFYSDFLLNPHWGEQASFKSENVLELGMAFQGFSRQEAEGIWRPFLGWVSDSSEDYSFSSPVAIVDVPARRMWDEGFLKQNYPQLIVSDDRPGAPSGNFLWTATQREVGQFLHAYHSVWLSETLLKHEQIDSLAGAIFAATRDWSLSLHFNKGLAGAPPAEIANAGDTAMNPAVLNAFALVILGSEGPPAFDGVGNRPDLVVSRRKARAVRRAIGALLRVASPMCYLAESNYFESNWKRAFWGSNYKRLLKVKEKYDPYGLFFIHHGVGSEKWSADGFEQLSD